MGIPHNSQVWTNQPVLSMKVNENVEHGGNLKVTSQMRTLISKYFFNALSNKSVKG